MDELTVIGAENGALIVVSADGTRFRVPITEALHTALRQNRPAAPAAHRVGPREVQAMIRGGLTAAEVAAQTGEPLDYIQRFEGPVLAEREYVIIAARAVPVAVAGEGEPGGSFGRVIDDRLEELSAREVRWTSRKKDALWIVSVSFVDGEVERSALWTFDAKKSTLAPANHEAQSLSQQGEVAAPLLPRLRAVPPEGAPSGRFDSGAFVPATEAPSPAPAMERPVARIAEAPGSDTADTQELGQTADLLEALRRRRGEREPAPGDDWDAARAAHPSTGSIRIVDLPLEGVTEEAADEEPLTETAPAAEEPAPAKPASRRGRAAMPSWDEIVFGARPDDDPA